MAVSAFCLQLVHKLYVELGPTEISFLIVSFTQHASLFYTTILIKNCWNLEPISKVKRLTTTLCVLIKDALQKFRNFDCNYLSEFKLQ